MRQLDRYLMTNLFWSILGVLGVLVGLDALSQLIDDLGDLSDTYHFSDLLVFIGLTIPRRIQEFVPYATLIGALFGLGRLATTSELTVMRELPLVRNFLLQTYCSSLQKLEIRSVHDLQEQNQKSSSTSAYALLLVIAMQPRKLNLKERLIPLLRN